MASNAEKAAAQARADQRKAERDQRLKTGMAVKFTSPARWFRSRTASN